MPGRIGAPASLTGFGGTTINIADPQRLMNNASLDYTAVSGDQVTTFHLAWGSGSGQLQIGVWNKTDNVLAGSETVTQSNNVAGTYKNHTLASPIALTAGKDYCMCWRAISQTVTAIHTGYTSSGVNHSTLTGADSLDSATWDTGTGFNSAFGIAATVEASASITSIGTDDSVAFGEADVPVAGAGLENTDHFYVTASNPSVSASYAVNTVDAGGTGFNITSFVRNNFPYSQTLTGAARDSGNSTIASHTFTASVPAGYVVKTLADADADKTVGESGLAGLGTIPANSTVLLPSTISYGGQSYTPIYEESNGNWTGRISFSNWVPPGGLVISGAEYRPGDTGVWEDLPLIVSGGRRGLVRSLTRELALPLTQDIAQ